MELMWANRCLLQDRRAEAERRVRATQELDQRAQAAAEAFRQVRDHLLTEESEGESDQVSVAVQKSEESSSSSAADKEEEEEEDEEEEQEQVE